MFSKLTSRPARAVASALLAGGLVLGTAACAPSTTDLYYGASDGTRATLDAGTLEVINLMILTAGEGKTAEIHGGLHNQTGTDDVANIVSVDGSLNLTVPVSAQDTVNFSTDDVAGAELSAFPAKPGTNVEATFTDQAGNTKTIFIPVLDGTLPEYKDYAPAN